ncbi:MAG: TraB/GumN family protein [Trueperaceae bacterium]|nr:TraB/GumN family protein [Trueperaceae bacterium]
MSDAPPPPDAPGADAGPPDASGGPVETVRVHGVDVTLLGTAHVSRASAEEVVARIRSGAYDVVALELDAQRHAALVDPDRILKTDLFEVVRTGRAGAMAANLALGAFQQRLADQYGIEPGQEMRDAIRSADEAGLEVVTIDRDIGTTLRRVYRNVPWWGRFELFAGLLGSVLSRDAIDETEIERLKEGDVLEATFEEFAEQGGRLYGPLIEERDAYMAARLEQEAARLTETDDAEDGGRPHLLAVIGAGHLKGVAATLRAGPDAPPAERIAALDTVPPAARWVRALPWAVAAVVITGFVVGFVRDPALGRTLLGDWVWINGGASAVGAILAAGHPFTVLGTAVAAPLTSLNPTIGAGFVAAAIEVWVRRPRVGDFASLRRDATTLRGWYGNRVARALLVFLGATLGSAIGTWVAGARILTRLF